MFSKGSEFIQGICQPTQHHIILDKHRVRPMISFENYSWECKNLTMREQTNHWIAKQITYDRFEENETRLNWPPLILEDDYRKIYYGWKLLEVELYTREIS